MDFSFLEALQLKKAFADNLKFQSVVTDSDYLNELFEHSNRGKVFIHDDENKGFSTFVTDTNGLGADKIFKIYNTPHKDLFLWHIDGVLYSKGSKCDCAFLTDRYLRFVEFKSNATNNTDEAIEDNYKKAAAQISNTHKDVNARCKATGVDLRKYLKLEAYAVFNRTVPKNNAHQKSISAKFLLDNKFKLYFKDSVKIE